MQGVVRTYLKDFMILEQLKQELQLVISTNYPQWQGPVVVEVARNEQFGDYATSVAMAMAKVVGKSPMELGQEIVQLLQSSERMMALCQNMTVAAPGFINLTVQDHVLWVEAVNMVAAGQPVSAKQSEKIMVEFSSPNIAKPFNVGHLRSTIIGDSIARMLTYLGHEVVRDNHVGDWGTQYGKLAYAVDNWGDWAAIEANPIPELFQLYVRFHQEEKEDPELVEQGRLYFKRLEEGDKAVVATWQRLVELSKLDFDQLYQRLEVSFDMELGESFYGPFLNEVVEEALAKGVARESQGALLIFFDDDPELKEAPLMIRKANGTSTYGTRDLAGIKYRFETFGLDRLVIEIGNEQRLYFRQIIEASLRLGWTKPGQLVHVGHGLFMLPSGKMSTRRGETVWVKDLIDELQERAGQIIADKSEGLSEAEQQQVAEQVAIGALKYNDLSQNRLSNVIFDKEKSLSLEGNSAPYLQYAVARSAKLLGSAPVVVETGWLQGLVAGELTATSVSLTEAERSLLLHLGKFDSVVQQAAAEYLPNQLALYLFQLSQKYNAFYQNDPILASEGVVLQRRLGFVLMTKLLLERGLGLLGITCPERM